MKSVQDLYHTSVSNANKIVTYTATSDFNTLGVDLSEFDGAWSLQVTRSATDGAPTVTIQCSNDNSNWEDYKESAGTDVTTGEIFLDDEFKLKYLRVQYYAGSGTGTVTMKLTLNK